MNEHHQDMTPQLSDIQPPSLEQILQTIRGVISEGESASASDDILLLTEILKDDGSVVNIQQTTSEPSKQASAPQPLFTQNYTDFSSRYSSHTAKEEVKSPTSTSGENTASSPQCSFLSEESAAVSAKALNDLLQAASLAKTNAQSPHALPFRSGQTLEDLVIELLKPQLSQWLDRNLPKLIQQLVADEIHKLLPTHKGDHR